MSRRQDLRILAAYANAPEQFPEGNVPIAYAAEKMGKDACFIRAGIEAGWLPIGYAFRKTGKSRSIRSIKMHTETKAMICTAAVLIAMGIFKELAAVCLITAVAFEEGVKRFDK